MPAISQTSIRSPKIPTIALSKAISAMSAAVEAAMAVATRSSISRPSPTSIAAFTSLPPAIETNVTGTFCCWRSRASCSSLAFVHISTDEVYGDIAPGAFADEDSPVQPSSPYSASKAGSDLLVRSYVRTYGFPGADHALSNNYGPYQFPEKFLPLMITNALTISLSRSTETANSSATGCTSKTIAGEFWRFSNAVASARCTISAGLDVEENLTMARRLLCLTSKSERLLSYVQDRPGTIAATRLNCEKIESELGWKPAIPLDEGLRQTIEWYKPTAMDGGRARR